jgi:nucleotide-binding universal stress UspA family protein
MRRWHGVCLETCWTWKSGMIEIRRILCPVDFSEFSRHAVHHAIAVAGWYQSELTVFHVFANLPGMDLPATVLTEAERDRLMADLREFVGPTPPELPVKLLVHEAADVRREILTTATALEADLLVIGSHGRSGFERLLLGSVTERVVRNAPCPVMVVPPSAPDAGGTGLIHGGTPRILCAVDFSEASLGALEYALSLAEEADADLTLLHSIEVPPELREHIPVPADFNIDQVRAAAQAACLRRLRDLVPPTARTYCRIETVVREGAGYRQILKLAADEITDLIVMGVHGRGAIDLLVFGSNTARVIRSATCPVLIVPVGGDKGRAS